MAEEKTFKKIEDLSEKKEEKEFLARSEIKTMGKDVAALRETQAMQEREKIAEIKTEEEMQKEKERELRAQKAALEREMAEKEAKIKEEELKRLREEREKKAEVIEKEETKTEETRVEEFKGALKETQIKEEEERRRFLARVEAKVEGKEELPSPLPPAPPPPPPEPKRYMPKLSFKKPSFAQKLWIRIVLTLLLLAILAAIATFWYWYLVVREKEAPPPVPAVTEEEIVPETPKIVEPLINERILEWGYHIPTTPRIIDTIVIHSTYNVFSEDPHDLEGIIQEYKYYGVAAHYLINRQGTIYRLAPDESVAYHAGVSQMPDGRVNVNDFSIGIELIQTKSETPAEVQYQSLTQLVKYLKQEYNILPENILGHKDVSPDRKTDPWNFDWGKFNQMIE